MNTRHLAEMIDSAEGLIAIVQNYQRCVSSLRRLLTLQMAQFHLDAAKAEIRRLEKLATLR